MGNSLKIGKQKSKRWGNYMEVMGIYCDYSISCQYVGHFHVWNLHLSIPHRTLIYSRGIVQAPCLGFPWTLRGCQSSPTIFRILSRLGQLGVAMCGSHFDHFDPQISCFKTESEKSIVGPCFALRWLLAIQQVRRFEHQLVEFKKFASQDEFRWMYPLVN
jgi:hypothetical protein